jgi:nucleotide-binding universal stress UspA family protein
MSGITVGVDGSANARGALDWAIREAVTRSAPVTVLTVNEVTASFWTGKSTTLPSDQLMLETARTAVTELASKAVIELGGPKPVSVTINAINGLAANELVKASKDADLLVVGARGGAQSGGLAGHTPIGSVSNKVLHHARCPVVVVPAS